MSRLFKPCWERNEFCLPFLLSFRTKHVDSGHKFRCFGQDSALEAYYSRTSTISSRKPVAKQLQPVSNASPSTHSFFGVLVPSGRYQLILRPAETYQVYLSRAVWGCWLSTGKYRMIFWLAVRYYFFLRYALSGSIFAVVDIQVRSFSQTMQ